MKLGSIVIATLLGSGVAAAPLSNAHAGSCESGTKIASDIWAKYDVVVKALGCAIVAVASEGGVPPNACLDGADKVEKVADQMFEFWNTAAQNSWARIGPRRIGLGETLDGKLVSTGGRLFVGDKPVSSHEIEVTIEKRDGKAETEVTVCKEYRGKLTKLWTFRMANGKDNVGKVWKKTFKGMRGHIPIIHLDAKSVANTMAYSVRIEPR
jgi:hypothetical protein